MFPNYKWQNRRQYHRQPSDLCSEEQLCGLQGRGNPFQTSELYMLACPFKNKTVVSLLTDFQAVLAKDRSTHARPAWSTGELQVSQVYIVRPYLKNG